MKIGIATSAQNGVYPKDGIVDAPNLIAGFITDELTNRGYSTYLFTPYINNIHPTEHIQSTANSLFSDFSVEEWSQNNTWLKAYSLFLYDANLLSEVTEYLKQNPLDLIHFQNHEVITTLLAIKNISIPKVITLHNPLSPLTIDIYKKFSTMYENFDNISFIGISNYQIKDINLNNFYVIPHGIDINKFNFNDQPTEEIVFVSRLNKNKGIDVAIKLAIELKKKISFKGRKSTEDSQFFDENIQPYLCNPLVNYEPETSRNSVPEFFAKGKVFLFPLTWEEPFGLVLLESMASGTPVIAYSRGAIPEIVQDGITGFIVNPSDSDIRGDYIIKKTGEAGLMEALERIYSMPRDEYKKMRVNCRNLVSENYTIKKMVDNYEQIYRRILNEA